jgi:hypothetical protein
MWLLPSVLLLLLLALQRRSHLLLLLLTVSPKSILQGDGLSRSDCIIFLLLLLCRALLARQRCLLLLLLQRTQPSLEASKPCWLLRLLQLLPLLCSRWHQLLLLPRRC